MIVKVVGLILCSWLAWAVPPGNPATWRAVPYVHHYGEPHEIHHRHGQGGHGQSGDHSFHDHDSDHHHEWQGHFLPLPLPGKTTYIQKLIPLTQLHAGGWSSFLYKKRRPHHNGWHADDSPYHESIWSPSGHPNPVPLRESAW